MNYLHVELPSLHLLWEKDGESRVCSVIRTNYPKPSLLNVAALMRSVYANVRVIDMKIKNQDTLIPYKKFAYEGGTMTASRMGMKFESIIEEVQWTDVIGLSINPTSWANIAIDFIKFARKTNPKVKIWVGGTDAMFQPNKYLEAGATVVILGEAEDLVSQLVHYNYECESICTMEQLSRISTWSCPYQTHEKCLQRPKIKKDSNIENLPLPALDLCPDDLPLWTTPIEGNLPKGAKAPIAFLFATRGCNHACDFCTTPLKYGRLRIRSLDSIQRELELYQKFGIKTICLWDDSLGSLIKINRRDWLIALVKMLRQMGFAFEFSQGISPKDLFDQQKQEPDYELITELYKHEIINGNFVGCTGEYLPFEFLQEEETDKAAIKLLPFQQELAVMQVILAQGIRWLTFSSIIGRPQDDQDAFALATERIIEIQAMIKNHGAESLPTPFIYSVFPGTKLWQSTDQSFLKYPITKFPELYQLNATPHGTNFFTPGQLMVEKAKMEQAILKPDQCAKWWKSGRYQW